MLLDFTEPVLGPLLVESAVLRTEKLPFRSSSKERRGFEAPGRWVVDLRRQQRGCIRPFETTALHPAPEDGEGTILPQAVKEALMVGAETNSFILPESMSTMICFDMF